MIPAKPNRVLSFTVRAVVSVIVLGVGVAAVLFVVSTAPTVAKITQEVEPPQVMVFRAAQAEVRRQWRGFGVVSAIDSADVPARVTAVVVERPREVQAGRPVKANALLARLDPSDFQKQVEIASERIAELDAQLVQLEVEEKRVAERVAIEAEDAALAQNEVNRLVALQKDRAAEQREVDQAKRVLITAQRSLLLTREQVDKFEARRSAWRALRAGQESARKLAMLNVDRCTIRSPIDGFLQTVDVEEGENLAAGQRVARVVSLGRVEVAVQLPVAARGDVVLGGEVTLTSTSDGSVSWKGVVARLAPEVDASARTLTVFVEIDQRGTAERFGTSSGSRLLTPGTFVNAIAFATATEQRWVVPRRSVRSERLLLVKDGAITSRPVTIDFVHEGEFAFASLPDDQWAVLSNGSPSIAAGDLIVVNASIAMRDGDRVQPMLTDGKAVPAQARPEAGKPKAAENRIEEDPVKPSSLAPPATSPFATNPRRPAT